MEKESGNSRAGRDPGERDREGRSHPASHQHPPLWGGQAWKQHLATRISGCATAQGAAGCDEGQEWGHLEGGLRKTVRWLHRQSLPHSKTSSTRGWGAPTRHGVPVGHCRASWEQLRPLRAAWAAPGLAALLEKAPVGCHLSLAAARDPRALTPSPHPPSVLSSLVVPQMVPKMPVPAVTQVCRAAWAMAASRLPRHEISHCSPKNIPLSSPTAPSAEGLGAVGQGGVGDKTHQCGVPDTKGPQKGVRQGSQQWQSDGSVPGRSEGKGCCPFPVRALGTRGVSGTLGTGPGGAGD